MPDIALLLRAAEFAAQKHCDQRRKGTAKRPYINHCIEVASLIANVGRVIDDSILVAALLHDTVEDTSTSRDEIAAQFGLTVADLVMEVSDDKSLPKQERKDLQVQHAPNYSAGAKIIKIADKISNVREIGADPPKKWKKKRRRQYFDWAESVVDGMGEVNAELEEMFTETLKRARSSIEPDDEADSES
jgi:guanosine-3',5'-bis(diphosphate) 3'-pyrophosphohydrolase